MDPLVFNCPHCSDQLVIDRQDINCAIFRHGVFKATYEQMNPHETKENCDALVAQELIYGCGKPFKLEQLPDDPHNYNIIVCDYI